MRIVEAAKCRRHTAQRADQSELGGNAVDDEPEPCLLRECEALLGFPLRLGKRSARQEKVRVQLIAAVGGVSEVADFVCRLERAA